MGMARFSSQLHKNPSSNIASTAGSCLRNALAKKLYVGKLWFVPALNARRAQERLGI
jgi:hypothetical protein